MKIAKDGYLPLGVMLGSLAVSSIFAPALAAILLLPTAVVGWFYRDPERHAQDTDSWISPADGKVVEIDVLEREKIKDKIALIFFDEHHTTITKIGIFMNALDVHVNRAPAAASVIFTKYVPGKRLVAFNHKASEENERFYVGFDTQQGRTLLVQIAGLLARRITRNVTAGDKLTRTQRYGMIKLGSKVDIYMPDTVKPAVTLGQRVKAGQTPIGVIRK